MSTAPQGVDEADRLARVKLSCTIEPGDIRVTGLVSEVGVRNVLGYLEAAADIDTHCVRCEGLRLRRCGGG